jgi:hypothetical protein
MWRDSESVSVPLCRTAAARKILFVHSLVGAKISDDVNFRYIYPTGY